MKVGMFMPEDYANQSMLRLSSELKSEYGVDIECIDGCLCEKSKEDPTLFNKYPIILLHPHRKLSCTEKIRGLIKNNPNNEFYIYALGDGNQSRQRRREVGLHKNLEYITNGKDSNKALLAISEKTRNSKSKNTQDHTH